jgi:hypothetical protein
VPQTGTCRVHGRDAVSGRTWLLVWTDCRVLGQKHHTFHKFPWDSMCDGQGMFAVEVLAQVLARNGAPLHATTLSEASLNTFNLVASPSRHPSNYSDSENDQSVPREYPGLVSALTRYCFRYARALHIAFAWFGLSDSRDNQSSHPWQAFQASV